MTSPSEEQAHWTGRFGKSILFITVTLVIAGFYLALRIPVAVFPSTDFPRVIVAIDNGVAPIDQMMVTVTRPLEEAVNVVPGLERVRSITSRGSAEISLFFAWDVDIIQTLQLVNAALAEAQPLLPPTAHVSATRLTFASFPIIGYSLTSDTLPPTQLWELATYDVKPRLNRLPGVSTVVVQGGQEPEFEIMPDPGKLAAAGVTVPGILDAVARSNLIDSPGMLETHHDLVLALVSGQARNSESLGNLVVTTSPSGTPIHIHDVAKVGPSVKPVYIAVTANGKPAVLLNVSRQPDGNTVTVAREVRTEIDEIRKALPGGVELKPFYDQSEIVEASIASVRDAVLIGLVLASLILVFFLRDWGSSLVAGLVIPATVGITLVFLRVTGESFNLMTLGGLAAAVGLIIDDAIVVVENIVLHRDLGQSRGEAIRSALAEIRAPLIGSTITPIVVFLPLISIGGVEGVFFRALAITVGTSLLTSLVLALTWTPTLSHYFLRRRAPVESKPTSPSSPIPEEPPLGRLMTALVHLYERVIRRSLRHLWVMAGLCLGLIVASWICYESLGSDLLPAMDEGGFIVDYLMPAGTSLTDTNRVLTDVERTLADIPEVEGTSRRTGLELGFFPVTEANSGDISVKLKRDRTRSIDEVISEAREKIHERQPILDVEFMQLLQDMIFDLTGTPEPIEIKLFSQNADELREWAPRVGEAIQKVDGVVDVLDGIENTISGPAITFQVDPDTAARAGFTTEEVEQYVSAILQGEPSATPLVAGDRAYTIRVRFPENARSSLDDIRNLVLHSATGKNATLGSLATMTQLPGQTEILRDNLQRLVTVTGRFEGVSLSAGIERVRQAVNALGLPPSIRVAYGGGYEEQQRSFHDLVVVLIMAVLLVFIVLLFEFQSFAAPLAILSSALLSTSGVFFALLVTGVTFNISSFMGLIMVIGIVAKNGILLLDADQKYRAAGYPPDEAMARAGARRLRPILMTALATVAGMLPLALGIGAGSAMLQPLAIAVIGGIAASMILSLIVTPVAHYAIAGRKTAE
ncbi:MAG TPA: efflux RND transporter permease subunit [Terriglobia bacterium]|nr:efflux RND transporter permease subunit [Terriglobia bacterium]